MTFTEQIITIAIAIVVLGTMATRFLPFVIFNSKTKTPAYVQYLGKVLPSATMSLLVVFSLRHVDVSSVYHGMPDIIAVAVTVLLHLWKGNMFLSIGGGTILYMVLVQQVFI